MTSDERRRLVSRLIRFTRMLEGNYPPLLKAHYFAAVLIPAFARAIGIQEMSEELTKLLTRGMALHTGVCVMCVKANAIPGEDVCPKCLADFDQFCAEIEEHEGE